MLGILGFVLATPLAAVVLVLTRFYRSDILGDELVNQDEAKEGRESEQANPD